MKGLFVILFLNVSAILYAQESVVIYKEAMNVIENSAQFKNLGVEKYTMSLHTISYKNQAHAFWLIDPFLQLGDYDFENHLGEFYQSIENESFASLRKKRRSKVVFFVTETDTNLFIIELLHFKRKRKAKYPRFYQGKSYSFLFKKESDTNVKLIRIIELTNN